MICIFVSKIVISTNTNTISQNYKDQKTSKLSFIHPRLPIPFPPNPQLSKNIHLASSSKNQQPHKNPQRSRISPSNTAPAYINFPLDKHRISPRRGFYRAPERLAHRRGSRLIFPPSLRGCSSAECSRRGAGAAAGHFSPVEYTQWKQRQVNRAREAGEFRERTWLVCVYVPLSWRVAPGEQGVCLLLLLGFCARAPASVY